MSRSIKSPRAVRIAGRFSAQMSSQMSGCPLAMRVMSRNPPAASRNSAACSSPRSAARPIKPAAARCGDVADDRDHVVVVLGADATTSAPNCDTMPATAANVASAVTGSGVRHPHGALEHRRIGTLEALQLAAGHRVPTDEAGVVDGRAHRALDAADVGHEPGGLGERPLDLVGDRLHRYGDERDLGSGVEPHGIDTSARQGRVEPSPLDLVTRDVPAGGPQGKRDRAPDEAQADHVGAPRHPLTHGPEWYRGGSDGSGPVGTRRSCARRRTSSAVSTLHAPGARRWSRSGPTRVRTKRCHRVSHRLAHSPDLPVPPLVDRDPQHAGMRLGHLGRRGRPVVERDAVAQSADGRRAHRTAGGLYGRQVLLGDSVARMQRCGWPARRRW